MTRHVMETLGLLVRVIVVVAVAVALGIAVYAGVSFALMRAHTTPRTRRAAARAFVRELFWAALTQPLLPLFYFVGRRMGAGTRGGVPVVFVHGYMQNRVDFLFLARALTRAGCGPLYGFNYAWFAPVGKSAKRLARFVARVRAETGAAEVDLVCHSLGGVVAMEYLASAGETQVRRCITVASPHAGVAWRGPIIGACADEIRAGSAFLRAHAERRLATPCLSVYSTHDNVVHPPATSSIVARGGRDEVIDGLPHLAILFSPALANVVVRELASALVETGHAPQAAAV